VRYDNYNFGNTNKRAVPQYVYFSCHLAVTCFGTVAILKELTTIFFFYQNYTFDVITNVCLL